MSGRTVTLIPGDGVGPSLVDAATAVLKAAGARIEWDLQEAGADVMEKYGTPLPEAVLENIRANRIAYKGPITTPVGSGFRSVNVALRKKLDLYACVRPAFYIEGVRSPYKDVDLVVVRENMEDLYAGLEHMVTDGVAESIKVITRRGSERVVRFAFEKLVPANGPAENMSRFSGDSGSTVAMPFATSVFAIK